MRNLPKSPIKKHFWSSNLHLEWDSTTMPMINADLRVSKNEISLQVFNTQNAGRAGKVLEGQSTDMEDMMNLCNHYHIDICQFMRLPDGSHPIMMHRDEWLRMKKAAEGTVGSDDQQCEETQATNDAPATNDEPAPVSIEADVPTTMRFVDDRNVSALIEQMNKQATKIDELYGRIIDLTEDNARMRAILAKPYSTDQKMYGGIVADDGQSKD